MTSSLKSLAGFPAKGKVFDPDKYGHDLRAQVAAMSPYKGEVGIELELEGRGLPPAVNIPAIGGATWVPHTDGSLRNGGMEYVLSAPVDRQHVGPLTTALFKALTDSGAVVRNSTRCSTHVHLNMSGVRLNQLCSLVALWGCFEDVLSNWCGPHRSGNLFALRMSDSEFAVDQWERGFRLGSFRFNRDYRYLALNPACLSTFGSLEVRTMRGADTPDEVVAWTEVLLAIRDAALSPAFASPTAIAEQFSALGPAGFIESILGQTTIYADLRPATEVLDEDFDKLIMRGFRRVQPIIYSLPWDEVNAELSKPYVPDPFAKPKTRAANGRIPEMPAPRFRDPEAEARAHIEAIRAFGERQEEARRNRLRGELN